MAAPGQPGNAVSPGQAITGPGAASMVGLLEQQRGHQVDVARVAETQVGMSVDVGHVEGTLSCRASIASRQRTNTSPWFPTANPGAVRAG